mmetsp:Transcript_144537/g.402743  ORF Transcript_144537/g.402743 Transcript_144537/m.402743 type:complete len:255 (+) Transcript_144537:110-874(+)
MLPAQPQIRSSSPSERPPPQMRHSSSSPPPLPPSTPSGLSVALSGPLLLRRGGAEHDWVAAANGAAAALKARGSSSAASPNTLPLGLPSPLSLSADGWSAWKAAAMVKYLARVGCGNPRSTEFSGTTLAAALQRASSSLACSAMCSSTACAKLAGNHGNGGRCSASAMLLELAWSPLMVLPSRSARNTVSASSAMPSTATRKVSCRRKSLYSSGWDMSIIPGSFKAGISFMSACSCKSTTRKVNVGCQPGPGQV